MSEELKHQESTSIGILLSIIDGSINHTFRNAPSSEAALEALQELAKQGPIHPGTLTRIYMEGQNALFIQLGNILRFALSVSGWGIDGTILEPMSPVAAQHRQELYDRMEQLAKEAAAAESVAEESVAESVGR